eukprot:TRINITY_DN35273_c0_g1_i1.p1 TRINITY_DN35273_c0_g1~~TRINITY_DN35273_c0_g1_i1.p1  ORF type:complete len:135 (+),score=24.72 TRINITY_DN35273_c0_g1_i1:72-476(+)
MTEKDGATKLERLTKEDWQHSMMPTDQSGFTFDFGGKEEDPVTKGEEPATVIFKVEENTVKPVEEVEEAPTENMKRILKTARKTLMNTFRAAEVTGETVSEWKDKRKTWRQLMPGRKRTGDDGEKSLKKKPRKQ